MSFREGRGQLMIFSAVLTILWNLCASASVQWGKPHCVAVQQDALYCRPVKGYMQLLTHTVLPEHSHKVQALLGLFDDSCGLFTPGEVN